MSKGEPLSEEQMVPWTQFMDMHSGGGQKLAWAYIYIQAPEKEAAVIFQNRFGRNPHRVTCTCCGDDYSLTEYATLQRATAYNRGCRYAYFDKDGQEVKLPPGERWAAHGTYEKGDYVEEPDRHYNPSAQLMSLEDYVAQNGVKIIPADEIKPHERTGELNEEGYVWR